MLSISTPIPSACRYISETLIVPGQASANMAVPRMKLVYVGVRVRDLERSLKFYKALGLKTVLRGKMEHGGTYVQLKSPSSPQILELNYYPEDNRFYEAYRKGSELDHLGFWASDVNGCIDYMKNLGAKVVIEPWDEGRFRLAFVEDPDGICIELLGLAKRRKEKVARKRSAQR